MMILDLILRNGVLHVRKDKRYYKYDRETPIMEVMLQKSIIDKIFKNYL